jgi:drug/metabolite transporter (DMT)-like permease
MKGYVFLFLQALIFSFGGLLIKGAGTVCSPFLLSALRFLIGILLLLILQKMRYGRLHLTLASRVVIIGGICKAVHYVGENYGVMKGFSYGGILVWPVQTVAILLISIFIYKERFAFHVILGAILCTAGIGVVSWNGASADVFMQSQATTLLAFVFAGIGACIFTVMQKKLVQEMDSIELNSSMFSYGLLTTLFVLVPTGPHGRGPVSFTGVICIILLGIITCVGFLLQAEAIKTVPLFAATILQSCTVILNIVWGVLFYGDKITPYVLSGSAMFLIGMLIVNTNKQAGKNRPENETERL